MALLGHGEEPEGVTYVQYVTYTDRQYGSAVDYNAGSLKARLMRAARGSGNRPARLELILAQRPTAPC